ncbi:MAG: hypothetical protein BA863_01375 [Desulfovibrio sp. S3730MH75]|nr:MAG: hypothetical protein BA863_01375 [Desulfovibrio sp. S3730MH75]
MKISIAMATYNGAEYIQEQLDSFAVQTRCPDELVICDDGSHDETVDIIEKFMETVNFQVRFYRNNKRLGFAANFEKAINLCNCDIIVLSDQDDIWYPDKLETLKLAFDQSEDVGFVISNADILDERGNDIGKTLWQARNFSFKKYENLCNKDQFRTMLQYAISTGMVSAFIKKVRKIAGPLPEGMSHDSWYLHVAAGLNITGVILSRSLVGYRQHERQAVGTAKIGLMQKIFKQFYKQQCTFERKIYYRSMLLDRMKHISSNLKVENVLYLENEINHLEIRDKMKQFVFWKRFVLVIRELANGRYKKYSGGFPSAFSDLVPVKCLSD